MAETFSSLIQTLKLKAFQSATSSLTDPNLLVLVNDSYRSTVVPFCKSLRDEWQVAKDDYIATTDSDGRIDIPNSVASTMRTVAWKSDQYLVPLTRIEPENAFRYQQNSGSQTPGGFMLKGYQLVILPTQATGFEIHVAYMRRPPEGVLEEDAGEVVGVSGFDLTLDAVPLAWQASAPTSVDLISNNSPFSPIAEDIACTLAGNVLTLSGISSSLLAVGYWVSDVGTSPFPNIPTELHPLLELDVINTLFGTMMGDKRGPAAAKALAEMKMSMLKMMGPRTQGNTRPIVNYSAPGMSGLRFGGRWGGR